MIPKHIGEMSRSLNLAVLDIKEERKKRLCTWEKAENIRFLALIVSKKQITLSDNSKWETTGIDNYKTSTWLPMNTVMIKRSGFNYQMTNKNKNAAVEAIPSPLSSLFLPMNPS